MNPLAWIKGAALWLIGLLGAVSWGLLERSRRHKVEAERAEQEREAEELARNAQAGATEAILEGEKEKEKIRHENNSDAANFND